MSTNKTNITVIIPVHEITEVTENYFKNSIQSVSDQSTLPDEVLIVVPANSSALEFMSKYDFNTIKNIVKVVENPNGTDFVSQLNYGVSQVNTEWFTLLEYDDEFAKIWIKNANEYKNIYTDVDVFLPIVVDVNEDGAFLGLTNEAVWAQEFSDELGLLDNNALQSYQNFNIDGMMIKKSVYEEMGGIKESIKLTFIYEFFLRLTFYSTKIMVIPRFGYKHVNQRANSLFHNYREELKPDEARWWMSLAKKEYFHLEDRKITYSKD